MEFLSLVLSLFATLALLQALLSVARRRNKTSSKLPPGPHPLPVIGNLLNLGDKPHKSLAELSKIHGPIMSLKLGQITTIVISSSTAAKQVLQKQDLAFSSYRSIPNALHAHHQYKYSVIWLPVVDDRWRTLRKFMNTHIFSAARLDANVHIRRRKVEDLVDFARKCCEEGVAVDIGRAAFTTTLNSLSNTLFSVDLADQSRDSAREFRDTVWNIMLEAGKSNLVDCFPALAKIDPQGIRRRMTIHFDKILKLFGRLIDQRLELRRLSKTKEENDVIDNLLNVSEENSGEIDRIHIERMLLDIFAAGTDTSSSTVEWALAELLHNPETLKRAKAELEQTIGKGKKIEESDVASLPYLRAIVKETFRKHPPAPFLIPRKVESDVELCGYTVPKGAQVLVNAWAIGRDPEIWEKPTSFVPERFLESEMDVKGRDFQLIPFGAGRRICPGLPLAARLVPVMVGSLVNTFDWKLEGGIAAEDLDMEEKFGITLQKALPLRAVPIHV